MGKNVLEFLENSQRMYGEKVIWPGRKNRFLFSWTAV